MSLPPHPGHDDEARVEPTQSLGVKIVIALVVALIVAVIALHLTGVIGDGGH